MHAMTRDRYKLTLSGTLGVVTLLLSSLAHASPNYPDKLQELAQMPCTPVCTICHTDSLGGRGTVTQQFGVDMRKGGGLVGADTGSLENAVESFEIPGEVDPRYLDADNDGVDDITELRQGTNPNGDRDPLCSDLHYGCRATAASRDEQSGWPGVLIVALAALRKRRRR